MHVDEVAQSLEMTEPSNAPCSEVTERSDVSHSSEVAGPSSSSERIVSLHALNNKEKHIQKLLTQIHVVCALVHLKMMSVMETELDGYDTIVEDGCMRTV